MGREIRMVPKNWQHPKDDSGQLMPMYDKNFAAAAATWREEFLAWERRERPDYCDDPESRALEFWEWHSAPPDRAYYRPWKDQEAVWFQLWETVSEGTPVSPPFATREELAAYLAEHGDFWDQSRGTGPWGTETAKAFVEVGWAPSLMAQNGVMVGSKDIPLFLAKNQKP